MHPFAIRGGSPDAPLPLAHASPRLLLATAAVGVAAERHTVGPRGHSLSPGDPMGHRSVVPWVPTPALAVGTSWRARQVLAEGSDRAEWSLAGEFVATDCPPPCMGRTTPGQGGASPAGCRARCAFGGCDRSRSRRAIHEVLARAGVRVTVLETRGRVGGRVRTDRRLGVPLEMELRRGSTG